MPSSEIFRDDLLAGRVALVTGGGTGLGKAASAELLRCGANVVIAGRRAEVLDAAVAELGADGGGISAVAGDARAPEDAERIVRTALDRHGRLDVLVNNAGGQYFSPAEAIAVKGWRAVHRLNIGATELMTRTAFELAFAPQRSGTVVNVTLSPHHGLAGMTHSSAARAAVEGYTRALAAEWAPLGIAVLAIAAGHFRTDAIRKYPDSVQRSAGMAVPLGRLGEPEEHAWLVALCAGPLGRALSGSVVTLDGARDDWYGPWPPASLLEQGAVPTEARRPGGPPA
jgi:citronellol/citronellal dehydrogenase